MSETEDGPGTGGDPRIPSPEDCVLPKLLVSRAERRGDRVFAIFEDGSSWSYRRTLELVRGTAAALARLGVRRGDRVLVWMTNGPDLLRVYLALGYSGAIFVPINTALRGSALEHVIGDADCELLILDGHLVDSLRGIRAGAIRRAVAFGSAAGCPGGIESHPGSVLDPDPEAAPPEPAEVAAWDVAVIHYTSSAHSEEDILAVVALRADRSLGPAGLIAHLAARLPRFMVPRYVRIVEALPLTETNKVRKKALREEGVTSDTWDREAGRTG